MKRYKTPVLKYLRGLIELSTANAYRAEFLWNCLRFDHEVSNSPAAKAYYEKSLIWRAIKRRAIALSDTIQLDDMRYLNCSINEHEPIGQYYKFE